MRSLVSRLETLEKEFAQRARSDGYKSYAERLAAETAFEKRTSEILDRLERERAEYAAADKAGKLTILRTKLARWHERWNEREPWRDPGREPYYSRYENDPWRYAVGVRNLELDIAELEGALTPEQIWVAREKTYRSKLPLAPVPTHEQALAEIVAGDVGYSSQPESLKGRRAGKEYLSGTVHEEYTGTLVPNYVGPQVKRPVVDDIRDRSEWRRPIPKAPRITPDKAEGYRDQELYFEPNAI